ncbi:MAG: hypothetical protein HC837_16965 [Chloroflexaceae bacterium]|nr:hypothetical protein [Chloroflexaceae bacterium]
MDEIGFIEVIDQIKRELIDGYVQQQSTSPPMFVMDRIEIEMAVKVARASDGSAKLTVLGVAEVGGGQSEERERGHVVRVSLTPLLPQQDILAQWLEDPVLRAKLAPYLRRVLTRDEPLLGEPE